MAKTQKIIVNNIPISIINIEKEGYICITDMVSARNDESRAADVIKNWLRNRGTIEFLGTWETLYNKNFKVVEFDHFRKEAGLPSFVLSVSGWVEATNAIGIFSKPGKNGGTYAHRDIALEFGSAISPIFKIYLIREYQRLKEIESDTYNLEWDVKRILAKVNYGLHTDAISKHIIPKSPLPTNKQGIEYANEADLLNLALFGCTAKAWREVNPELAAEGKNIRDFASINELAVMSNLESLNAEMIKLNASKQNRFNLLSKTATDQLEQLKKVDIIKAIRKQKSSTYIEAKEKNGEELENELQKSITEKNQAALEEFQRKKNLKQ
jgi:KilA-N domain